MKIIIEKIDNEYCIYQDGCYEKIDGCLNGDSDTVKSWKTINGAINYCRHYADEITLPYGDVITIKRKKF